MFSAVLRVYTTSPLLLALLLPTQAGAVLPKTAVLASIPFIPLYLTADAAGNVYFAGEWWHTWNDPCCEERLSVYIQILTRADRDCRRCVGQYIRGIETFLGNSRIISRPGTRIYVVASGLNSPYGLTIDASNNLYVSDVGSNDIEKIPAGSSTPVVVASGFNSLLPALRWTQQVIFMLPTRIINAIKKIAWPAQELLPH